MSAVPPVLRLSDVAPALVLRLGLIVAGLASVVARRFLREPKFVGLIVPLWGWLSRSARRFGRVAMRPVAPAAARRDRAVTPRAAGVRLPSRRGWLVRALGWEAAGYGCQLEALLAEPEMVALLAAVPAVGRVLRPLGRMLGVRVAEVTVAPVVEPVAAEAPARTVAKRRPRPPVVEIKRPRTTRPDILGPGPPVVRGRW